VSLAGTFFSGNWELQAEDVLSISEVQAKVTISFSASFVGSWLRPELNQVHMSFRGFENKNYLILDKVTHKRRVQFPMLLPKFSDLLSSGL